MKNEIIFNAAEHKFTAFSNEVIQSAPEEFRGENWYVKLAELDAKIHATDRVEKINFTDDRLVMIAHKVLCQSEVFSEKASLREWWIAYRYLELYAKQDTPLINELRKLINMYIGFTFSEAQITPEQSAEVGQIAEQLKGVVYEDGYVPLPQFVLDLIEGDDKEEEEEKPAKARKKKEQPVEEESYDFTDDEAAQWTELKDTAELMLSDTSDMTDDEVEQWNEALETANLMLNI